MNLETVVSALPNLTKISWAYATAMLAAIAVFFLVDWLQGPAVSRQRLSTLEKWALFAAAFVGGSLGGKLPFALATGNWWSMSAWFMDGKTITTGLVGAYLMVELAKQALGVKTKTGDRFALPLAAALAVGRWGCFFNGCCFGTTTDLPWGITFPGIEGVRHPTQIYESLFHATMFLVLLAIVRKGLWLNHRLQIYLLSYCLYRFITEWIRPEVQVGLGLTFYQWVVLGFALAIIVQWAIEVRRVDQEPPLTLPQEPH